MAFDQLFGSDAAPAPDVPAASSSGNSFGPLFSGNAAPATNDGTTVAPAAPTAVSNLPPALTAFGAGIEQGGRDINITADQAENWLRGNVPGYSTLSNAVGYDPAELARLQAQTQAYRQQYGDSTAAWLGRLGSGTAISSAIPIPGANPLVRGMLAGGVSSAMSAGGYDENPLVAGAEGALGGAAIGGVTGALMRPVDTFLTNTADRLGITLSQGAQRGGVLHTLEGLTEKFPGSGAGPLTQKNLGEMTSVMQRGMGTPETGSLDLPTVANARRAAGADVGSIAGTMNVDGSAMVRNGIAGGAPMTLLDRLDQIHAQAATLGADTPQARAADALRSQIQSSMTTPGGAGITMAGPDLRTFLATGNTLDNFADSDSEAVRGVAAQVRNAVYQAIDSTPSNPTDALKNFQAARLRYKAAITANDAIKQSGSTDAMTPNALKQAIFRNYSDQLEAGNTGPGYDIPDLGRLLQARPKFGTSGTAEHSRLFDLAMGAVGAVGGAGGYFASPHALAAGIGAAVPFAAMSAAGRASRLGAEAVPYVGRYAAPFVQAANPLLPRLVGRGAGNLLAGGSMPQPQPTQ